MYMYINHRVCSELVPCNNPYLNTFHEPFMRRSVVKLKYLAKLDLRGAYVPFNIRYVSLGTVVTLGGVTMIFKFVRQ